MEQDRKPTTEPLHSVQQPEVVALLDESEEAHLLLMQSIVHVWDDQDDEDSVYCSQHEAQRGEKEPTGTAMTPTSDVNKANSRQDPGSALLFYAALEPKIEPLRLEVAHSPSRSAGATSDAELAASAGKQLRETTHGIHTLLFDVSAAISQVLVSSDFPPSRSRDETSARSRSESHQQLQVSPAASGAKASSAARQQHSPPPWGLVHERALVEPSRTSPDQRRFSPMRNTVTTLIEHDGPDSQTRRIRSPDNAAARARSAYHQDSPPNAAGAGHRLWINISSPD